MYGRIEARRRAGAKTLCLGALSALLFASGCLGGDDASRPDGGEGVEVVPGLDLAVRSVEAPSEASAGESMAVVVEVANVGDVDAHGVSLQVTLGHVSSPDGGGQIGLRTYSTLAARDARTETVTTTLPENLATGDYVVTATVTTGGEVELRNNLARADLHVLGSTCEADAFEDDDVEANATPLGDAVRQDHNFCFDPVDWMTFDAVAGRTYAVQAGGEDFAPALQLVGAGGEVLAEDGTGWLSGRSRLEWTAPFTGAVRVLAFAPLGVHDTGAGTEWWIVRSEPRPDLTVWGWTSATTVPRGGVLRTDCRVTNQGFTEAAAGEVAIYLSEDETLDAGDLRLGTAPAPGLPVNESAGLDVHLTVPADHPLGTRHVLVRADPDDRQAETDEANNVVEAGTVEIVDPACPPDAYEEDDDPSGAAPLLLDAPQSRNHCEDAVDWLTFEAQAGVAYELRSEGHEPLLAIYPEAGGEPVASADDSLGLSVLRWTAPTTGPWLVRAGEYAGRIGTDRDYVIQARRVLPDLFLAGYCRVDTGGTGEPALQGGLVALSCDVFNGGLTASPESTVVVALSSDAAYDAGDRVLARLPIAALEPSTFDGAAADADLVLPPATAPGAWHVLVRVDPDDDVLELDETNNAADLALEVAAPPCAPDAWEDDDLPALAPAVVLGEAQDRNQCDDGVDWLRLPAAAGRTYRIQTAPDRQQGFFANTEIYLYDLDGASLLQKERFTDLLEWTAPASGDYFLRIGAYPTSNGAESRYRVTVSGL